ncbi:hypothetical protein ACHQM5_001145 [Ranunculus cassubicifolius]
MFTATVELISLVYSNSLLMFFVCNFIIIILHTSYSKSNPPPFHHEASDYATLNPKRIENKKMQDDECLVSIDIEESPSGLVNSPNCTPKVPCHESVSVSVTATPIRSVPENTLEDELMLSSAVEASSNDVLRLLKEKLHECYEEDIFYVSVNPMRVENGQIEENGTLVLIDIESSSDAMTEVPYAVDELVNHDEVGETDYNEEEDELRKRVEEFIEKINRAWREEKVGTFTSKRHGCNVSDIPSVQSHGKFCL